MTTRVDVTGWHEWWSTDPNRWKVLINKNKKRKKSLRVTNKIKAATTSTDSFLSETTDPFRQVNSITWLSFMSWNVVSMRINLHFFLKKLTTWSGCVMLVTNGTTRYRFVFFFFKKKKIPLAPEGIFIRFYLASRKWTITSDWDILRSYSSVMRWSSFFNSGTS